MKRLILGLVLIISLVMTVSAVSPCESACAEQKNQDLSEVQNLRNELIECKPNFLDCIHETNKNDYAVCRDEYTECKWGGRQAVKDKTIEVNNKYNDCAGACTPAQEMQEISMVVEESPFCKVLGIAKENFVKFYGAERFEGIASANGCQVKTWGFL